MASGGYVGDDLTSSVVAQRLDDHDVESGFLLDGYPRTAAQVAALDGLLRARGVDLDAVVLLHVVPGAIVDRMFTRALKEGRADDTPEAIQVRLHAYQTETQPLVDEYGRRGLIVNVDGSGPAEEVLERIVQRVHVHLASTGRESGSPRDHRDRFVGPDNNAPRHRHVTQGEPSWN